MKKPVRSKEKTKGIWNKISKPFVMVWKQIKRPFIWLAKFKIVRTICKPLKVFVVLGRYFKDSWVELKQVRWSDRKATWGLTIAVIAYSIFFVAMIVLLDLGFDKLFKLLIG